MKILHVADTHLGFSAYRKVTEDGINQREVDVYDAFNQLINYALQSKPDLILHAGDLFDSVRPTNRALTVAINQILRLSKQKIPTVIIAGNHEHPKLKETGSILTIFDHIDHVFPVYQGKYEPVTLQIENQTIVIHAVPQCSSKKEFEDNIKQVEPVINADYNILLTHCGVEGIKEFRMNEFNELLLPSSYLKSDFDYIALGHYHKHTRVSEDVFYPGSTECFTFADAEAEKGFLELNVTGHITPRFIPLKTRPVIDFTPINCSHLSLEEVMNKIKETITKINPMEKIFRVTLQNIPLHIYRGIDFPATRQWGSQALHAELKADVIREGDAKTPVDSRINALPYEYEIYLKNQDINERDILLKLGMDYIQRIEARREGS